MDPKSIVDTVKEVIVAAALVVATEMADVDTQKAAELQDAQQIQHQERMAQNYDQDEDQYIVP